MSFSPGPLFKYCVSSPGQQQASSIPERSRKMGAGELLRETPLPLLFLGKHVMKTKRGERGVCEWGARPAATLGAVQHPGRRHFLERRQSADLAALVVDLNVRKKQHPGRRTLRFHPTDSDHNGGCLSPTNGVLESGILHTPKTPWVCLAPHPKQRTRTNSLAPCWVGAA